LVLALGTQLGGQATTGSVVRLDPSLDAIVSPTTKVEILKEQAFGLAEGPLWMADGASGYLLFSDIPANHILKWSPDRTLSVFLEKTGWTGTGAPPIPNMGSNGLTLDQRGRLVWVSQGDRAVTRVETNGTRTVLADRYQGKRFNRPNDLVVKSDGGIYFTDPPGDASTKELDFDGIFRIKDGNVQVLDLGYRSNGLAFSPDEKYLYVDVAGGKAVYRYEITPDGTLANRRVFIDMSTDPASGGTDGMKVDQQGNLYVTGPGGLWIVSPQGKHLGTVLTPEPIGILTNVAFGDPDGKTLYLTARKTLARMRVNVAGMRPGPRASVGGPTK
jgi:gluconolactonase